MKHIAVIGTGYVGLVAGTIFASVGNKVTCVDIDPDRISTLRAGKVPIYEPGLAEILGQAIKEGNIQFTQSLKDGIKDTQAIFIAVGTPSSSQGAYEGTYVYKAAEQIAAAVKENASKPIVVLKSTVTPEMYHTVKEIFRTTGNNIEVVSNPEFLAEGTAVRDFLQPDRVLIGCTSEHAHQFMTELYQPFIKREAARIKFMKPESAILAKLGANGLLASRVAYMNELAEYADKVGADIEEVRQGIGSDNRIGEKFLYAGPGFGGSCFGKDLRGLRESAKALGLQLQIIPAIETSNTIHKQYVCKLIEQRGSVKGKTFAVWGLAFKARTDDVRESPALDVIEYLLSHGAHVRVHDPQGMENAKQLLGDKVIYCSDKYEAVDGTSGVLLITEWDIYKNPDVAELVKRMKEPVFFDARNVVVNPRDLIKHGVAYVAMGRNGVFK